MSTVIGFCGRVARQRSAKPSTAVRIRSEPPFFEKTIVTAMVFFFIYVMNRLGKAKQFHSAFMISYKPKQLALFIYLAV